MADGAHDRGDGFGDRSDESLVAEGEQVLEGAATPGDHDDIHAAIGIELTQGGSDLRNGIGSLDRDRSDLELDCRPTPSGILDDVLLGGAGPTADEPDLAGQEGQRAFAVAVEQPLGRQDALEVLEPDEKLADPDRAYLAGVQMQGAAV